MDIGMRAVYAVPVEADPIKLDKLPRDGRAVKRAPKTSFDSIEPPP
jgi:hypothetical protein